MPDEVPTIEVKTATDKFTLHGRPCELSANSFIPPGRELPAERTVFNSAKRRPEETRTSYDQYFIKETGYNQFLHRDDRKHAKLRGLNTFEEESVKVVPTMGNSVYGHPLKPSRDIRETQFALNNYLETEFYRKNGVFRTSQS